jgi:hypothetical protein
LEALQWLHTSHNAASLIEIHSLHVAQAIGSNTKNNSEFGAVIEAGRGLLNHNCKVSYIRSMAGITKKAKKSLLIQILNDTEARRSTVKPADLNKL